MIFNKEFYPTPADLVSKMFSGIDFRMIESCLSAEKDIADAIVQKLKYGKYKQTDWTLIVEIDETYSIYFDVKVIE